MSHSRQTLKISKNVSFKLGLWPLRLLIDNVWKCLSIICFIVSYSNMYRNKLFIIFGGYNRNFHIPPWFQRLISFSNEHIYFCELCLAIERQAEGLYQPFECIAMTTPNHSVLSYFHSFNLPRNLAFVCQASLPIQVKCFPCHLSFTTDNNVWVALKPVNKTTTLEKKYHV